MLRNILCFFLLSMLLTACGSVPQNGKQNVRIAGESVTEDDADYSCAYFFFMWGKSAELDEKYSEALEAYEKAIVCDPRATYIIHKLIRLHMTMGNRQEALLWVERLISKSPDDVENYFLKAGVLTSMGEISEAIAVYSGILKKYPENDDALIALSSLYVHQQEYDKARLELEKLVRIYPDSAEGFHYLAKLYVESGLVDKALVAYEKSLDVYWSRTLAFEAARLYEQENRLDEAVRLYEKMLEEDGSNENVRLRLAIIYFRQGKKENALKELEKVRSQIDDITQYDTAVGQLLAQNKLYEDAIVYFKKALAIDPQAETARYYLALTYYETGDAASSMGELSLIPSTSDLYEDSTHFLIRILKEKNTDLAVAELEKRVSDPELRRSSFFAGLAALYRDGNETDKAAKLFTVALDLYPDDASLLFEYGLFLDRLGKMTEAMEAMQKVLEINPEDPYALNYVGYTWADQGIHLDMALEYTLKAVSLKPQDGYIRDSLGWVYFRMGKIKNAVQELELAVKNSSEDATITEHLGDAYFADGNISKAFKMYQNAVRFYEDDARKEKVRLKIQQAIEKYGPID